jgi:hypothetical protein
MARALDSARAAATSPSRRRCSQAASNRFVKPERLGPAEIDALVAELGGMTATLGEATPAEKSRTYQVWDCT